MGLTNRQRVFVEEYLKCWNAKEAALRAGYSERSAYSIGQENLNKPDISKAIEQRISEKAMSADEVLTRLAEHARGDMGDFMDISSMAFGLNLNKANELGLTRLIHKAKQRTTTIIHKDGEEEEHSIIELELYDAQAALEKLGRHLKLFGDATIPLAGKKITVTIEDDDGE